MEFIPAELIRKKKLGAENSADEIVWLIQTFVRGDFTDYQMAAWAMAVWFRGMTARETAALTEAMLNSGTRFEFSNLKAPRIDKHSTGGVGDKTSLILGPLLAAAKVHVPMIAGRGLGHTGGTLDKLESVPGFRVHLNPTEFRNHVRENFFSLMSQTEDICPADRKLYALRDVTSTVDSLPLICGSIMSKKLAEDLTGLVLDIKFGSGAFMKTKEQARALAQLLKATGEEHGVRVTALLTDMNQPLGKFIGNALEVQECLDIMMGRKNVVGDHDFYESTRNLTLVLAGHMLHLADRVGSPTAGYELAENLLNSGAALKAFHHLLEYQGPADLSKMKISKDVYSFVAPRAGYVNSIQTEFIGLASIELGAGRKKSEDQINHSTGIEMCCYVGCAVDPGSPLAKIYFETERELQNCLEYLNLAFEISGQPPKETLPIVAEVVT